VPTNSHRAHSLPKCAKNAFPLKIFFSRTKSGAEKLNTVKVVLYFVCKWHLLLRAYTFAVAASRLLRYKKLIF
jgi:hypothetical protein